MRIYKAYKLTCLPTGEQYVGITCQPIGSRWSYHSTSRHSTVRLVADRVSRYGRDAFLVEVVASALGPEEAGELERLLIIQENTKSPNGLNLTGGGIGRGILNPSQETRDKIAAAGRGKVRSPEAIAKFSAARMGHPVSEETRQKIREKNKLYRPTEEAKEKMRAAQLRRPREVNREINRKISASMRRVWRERRAES